jgi:uncharacterized protein
MELAAGGCAGYALGGMSNSRRFKAPTKPKKLRTLTLEQLEDWLDGRDPPAAGVSTIDGYLAALVVAPRFLPPEEWLWPIVGDRVAWAPDASMEGAVRNTLFKRYNEIGSTLSGGPKRYAPIYMRTDDGEVLLEDYANGFYLGMSLTMDEWQPFFSDPEIAASMIMILGHCEQGPTSDPRIAATEAQTAGLLAESWRVVPEVVQMLHVKLAGSRNIEIR